MAVPGTQGPGETSRGRETREAQLWTHIPWALPWTSSARAAPWGQTGPCPPRDSLGMGARCPDGGGWWGTLGFGLCRQRSDLVRRDGGCWEEVANVTVLKDVLEKKGGAQLGQRTEAGV